LRLAHASGRGKAAATWPELLPEGVPHAHAAGVHGLQGRHLQFPSVPPGENRRLFGTCDYRCRTPPSSITTATVGPRSTTPVTHSPPRSPMRQTTRPPLERIARIDQAVRGGYYPNARTLARELEVCPRTIQRDLAFLAERLGAPLEFDPSRNGYRYSSPDYR